MRGVNRVMLIGNLGKDPDTQHLEGHIAVAKFPLATTETFKDRQRDRKTHRQKKLHSDKFRQINRQIDRDWQGQTGKQTQTGR